VLSGRTFVRVKAQFRLPLMDIRTVALKAVLGQDRANISVELDLWRLLFRSQGMAKFATHDEIAQGDRQNDNSRSQSHHEIRVEQ
jgi:hypothetical protein